MDKKGYERLIKEESLQEQRLRNANQRNEELVAQAKKQAEKEYRDIIAEGARRLEESQAALEEEHRTYLETLKKQTATHRRRLAKKEDQLPIIAKTITQQLLKEWA